MTHIRTLMDQMIQIDEGRMKDIFTADQEGQSAEEIAKALKLPLGTVKKILGEDNDLQEFSDSQLDVLARQYAGLKGKTISVDNANKLRQIFKRIPDSAMDALRKKKIPFLSGLALSRMVQKGMPVKESNLNVDNVDKGDTDKEKELKIKLDKEKDQDALEKQLVTAQGQINILKQKLENEKNKAVKPEPNKETGEVPLTVGIAHKYLKDKQDKEKEEVKKEETINEFKKMTVTFKNMNDMSKASTDLAKQGFTINAKGTVMKVDGKGDDLNKYATDLKNFYGAKIVAEENLKEARWQIEGQLSYRGIGSSDAFHMVIDAPNEKAAEEKAYKELDKARDRKKIGPGGGGRIEDVDIDDIERTSDRLQAPTTYRAAEYNPEEVTAVYTDKKTRQVKSKKFKDVNTAKDYFRKTGESAGQINFREEVKEAPDPITYGPDKVAKAMAIATKSDGQYSKAVREIEKIAKDLSKVSTIARALKTANEDRHAGAKAVYEQIKGLKNKAEKTGMPYGILKKVYDRGMAAWRGGHRPGTTQQQWAFARVNSFVTKSSGTWGGADKDLAKQVKG